MWNLRRVRVTASAAWSCVTPMDTRSFCTGRIPPIHGRTGRSATECPGERGEVGTSALPAATRDSYDDFRGPSGAAPPLLTGEGSDEARQIVSYSLAARRG